MQNNRPRHKDETLKILDNIFKNASTLGGMSTSKKMKTEWGIKDTFQDFFTNRIFTFIRKTRAPLAEKQRLLESFIANELPRDVVSPVWRIKGA